MIFAAVTAVWLVATEPWGLGVYQLLMFTAPGALLGLGTSWMAHAARREEWTWTVARRSAIRGATILPPVLAFIVALDGNARPQRLLVGFVYAAWVALIAGAVAGLIPRRASA
jgi:hypothetical protein